MCLLEIGLVTAAFSDKATEKREGTTSCKYLWQMLLFWWLRLSSSITEGVYFLISDGGYAVDWNLN